MSAVSAATYRFLAVLFGAGAFIFVLTGQTDGESEVLALLALVLAVNGVSAAVLRAVADNAGTTDLSHPVLADVLTACEPLLPLIAAPEGTS